MKLGILLVFSLTLTCTSAFAHKYYFAFAEVEYNESKQNLEATLIFSAHDIEDVLIQQGAISDKLDKIKHDSLTIASIGKEILKGFKFISGKNDIAFRAIDFELSANGMLLIYFEAVHVQLKDEFEVEFSCLMDQYPEQQNKITYINQEKKQTAVFLHSKKNQKLSKI